MLYFFKIIIVLLFFTEHSYGQTVLNHAGIVVLGYLNDVQHSIQEKEVFQQDACIIYERAVNNHIPHLFITDPFSCKGKVIAPCEATSCTYENSKILQDFILSQKLKNLDIMIIGHGARNTDFGRPPEKNTISLGPKAEQTLTPMQLAKFISDAFVTSHYLNVNSVPLKKITKIYGEKFKIRFFYFPCYAGAFHEVSLELMTKNNNILSCGLSQSSYKRAAFINSNEFNFFHGSLFTQTFSQSLNQGGEQVTLLKMLDDAIKNESRANFPSFPGILAWQTSSMYYLDKISATGFFFDADKALYIPSTHLQIPYREDQDYPFDEPSFFSQGARFSNMTNFLNIFTEAQTYLKLSADQKNMLYNLLNCEAAK